MLNCVTWTIRSMVFKLKVDPTQIKCSHFFPKLLSLCQIFYLSLNPYLPALLKYNNEVTYSFHLMSLTDCQILFESSKE